MGYYVARDGTKVYCLSPRKATPSSLSLHTLGRMPGLHPADSAALAYALRTWGDARGRDQAAVESQVLNTLAGNRADVARRARHLPPALRRLTAQRVAAARAMRGPYRVRVVLPIAALPGVAATGSVAVTSAAGRPVPGVRIRLRASTNLRTPGSVVTGHRGTAALHYDVTDVGEAKVRAQASLPGTSVRVSTPKRGQQRLASWAPQVTAAGAAAFRAHAGGFSHGYACDTECEGRPLLTLSACAGPSRTVQRITYRIVEGSRSRTVSRDFLPAPRRHCGAVVTRTTDGARISATWRYRTPRGWSAPLTSPGSFSVDCPAAPTLSVTMIADCTRSRVTWTAGASRRPTVLLIAGARRATVRAAAGVAARWSTTAPCGQRLAFTARSGVQRTSGSWNYGPIAAVTTP